MSTVREKIFVGVVVGVVLSIFALFRDEIYRVCCKPQPPLEAVITASSLRVHRVDENSPSTCTLREPIEIISDGTKIGLIATDKHKSAVLIIYHPDGEISNMNGVGLEPVRIPKTNANVSANSYQEIGECDVRLEIRRI